MIGALIRKHQHVAGEAFLAAMTAFLRAFCRNAGTKAGMAASKGRSTFGRRP
jgi:hypothetical protein